MEIEFPHGLLEVKTGIGVADQYRKNLTPSLQASNESTQRIITEDALMIKEVDGWAISAKKPSAGYSEPSLMMVAAPIGETNDQNELHHTFLIYDAPTEVQQEYWKTCLLAINKAQTMSLDPANPIHDSFVFLTGHHCRHRQYDQLPSARSVMAHHDHIMIIPKNLGGEIHTANEFGLPAENAYTNQNKYPNLPYDLNNLVSFIKDGFNADLAIRKTPPYGYYFSSPNNPVDMTRALSEHFKAYKSAMEAADYLERSEMGSDVVSEINEHILIDNKKGRVVQPAFVLYLVPNQDSVTVIISPMLTGIGGPERAGILLKRGPDYPSRFTEEEKKAVVSELKNVLE